MEASRIVPFPAPEGLSIRVDRDRIVLERLVVHDPGLAAFVAERPEAERPGLLDRAIKIGLVALQDGDASRLAQLLDPTRLNSPMHQFRREITEGFEKLNDRLTAIEAAAAARATERSHSAAKGADFEELLEDLLGETARGAGDTLDRTSDEIGDV